ncbi:MAG: QueT transporter family protein [Clostridiales bacterium]|jgi:uncharacterized membrane protein|nr:QueT transporter family protein [Clostridiales bacterium]
MNPKAFRTQRLTQGAMIAAVYAVLTWAQALLPPTASLTYGPVQFRVAEALTILPVFTPAAIPGLSVGCLLANVLSGYGAADMVFGTLATLLAAVFTRMLRNIRIKSIPVLAPLPPVLFNAAIVGMMIAVQSPGQPLWPTFWSMAASVGFGELVVCYALGLPLAAALKKATAKSNILK